MYLCGAAGDNIGAAFLLCGLCNGVFDKNGIVPPDVCLLVVYVVFSPR